EEQRCPLFSGHELAAIADVETGRAALDKNGSDTVRSGAEANIGENDVGERSMGGEYLGTVDAVAAAVWGGGRSQFGDGRAGVGLGHTDGDDGIAAQQLGQKALALLGGAIFSKDADRAEIAGLHYVGAAWADRSNSLDGDDGIHQRAAHTATVG